MTNKTQFNPEMTYTCVLFTRICIAFCLSRLATIPIQMTTSERFDVLNDKCRHRYLLKIIIHLPIDLNDLIQQENFCLTTVVS